LTSVSSGAFFNCDELISIALPSPTNVHKHAFLGCSKLLTKCASFDMTIVEYYRDFYHKRMKERVCVLKRGEEYIIKQEAKKRKLMVGLKVSHWKRIGGVLPKPWLVLHSDGGS